MCSFAGFRWDGLSKLSTVWWLYTPQISPLRFRDHSAQKCEFGPVRDRIQSQPVDTPVLTDPVAGPHMIRMHVFGESSRLGLLGGEVTLLLAGDLKEPPRRLAVRLGQNTIPRL